MESQFEIFGYSVDYFVNHKLMGSMIVETPDREKMGYNGRTYSVSDTDMVFGKKRIKKGVEYYTECVPMCGRYIGRK